MVLLFFRPFLLYCVLPFNSEQKLFIIIPEADLASWLPVWHLPGGPVCQPARWAATSDVEGGSGTEDGAEPRGPWLPRINYLQGRPSPYGYATAHGAELCADELVVGGGVGWSYDRRRRRAAHFSSAAAPWLYCRRRRRRRRQTG